MAKIDVGLEVVSYLYQRCFKCDKYVAFVPTLIEAVCVKIIKPKTKPFLLPRFIVHRILRLIWRTHGKFGELS